MIRSLLLTLTLTAYAGPDMTTPDGRASLRGSVAPVQIDGRNVATGFAISDDFLITAAHVCNDPRIAIDDRFPSYVSYDFSDDLCVMRITDHGLDPLPIAGSLHRGHQVWVYGGPIGFADHLTTGYAGPVLWVDVGRFSGVRRQISAPSYGGNSGGPVLNRDGEVVGVLVAGMPSYPSLSFSATLHALRKATEPYR